MVVNYGCKITHIVADGVEIRREFFLSLVQYSPDLESLSLDKAKVPDTPGVPNEEQAIPQLISKCPKIRELNFYDCRAGQQILEYVLQFSIQIIIFRSQLMISYRFQSIPSSVLERSFLCLNL